LLGMVRLAGLSVLGLPASSLGKPYAGRTLTRRKFYDPVRDPALGSSLVRSERRLRDLCRHRIIRPALSDKTRHEPHEDDHGDELDEGLGHDDERGEAERLRERENQRQDDE